MTSPLSFKARVGSPFLAEANVMYVILLSQFFSGEDTHECVDCSGTFPSGK